MEERPQICLVSIVEDDKNFREALEAQVSSFENFRILESYSNTQEAHEGLIQNEPDIIVLDINLPDGSGIDLLKKLRAADCNSKVMMCTNYDDDDKIFDSLKFGANGYILKNSSSKEIHKALLDLDKGGAPMSMKVAVKVIEHFQASNHKPHLQQLTKKENSVLELLSQGMLYKEVADSLDCSINTIKKHCSHIYHKLKVNNRTEAINIYNNQ